MCVHTCTCAFSRTHKHAGPSLTLTHTYVNMCMYVSVLACMLESTGVSCFRFHASLFLYTWSRRDRYEPDVKLYWLEKSVEGKMLLLACMDLLQTFASSLMLLESASR